MTEVCLQRSGVVTSIRQRIAAGMSEHVRVRLETELRLDSCSLNHSSKAAELNGAPRSDVNTNGPLGSCYEQCQLDGSWCHDVGRE